MIDVHYASLISQGAQDTVFYRDGHPSRYQPRPTGLNFGEQTGTFDFFLVIAVPANIPKFIDGGHIEKACLLTDVINNKYRKRSCISRILR